MTKTQRPLIGVTTSTMIGGAWCRYSAGHKMDYLFREYTASLISAGGAPLAVPVMGQEEVLASILDRLDGLLLTGGPDLLPAHYGQDPMPGLGEVDADLDRMELTLTGLALKRELPILGICRGIQVLAVAGGGSLIQDIGSQVPDPLKHDQPADKGVVSHRIQVAEPSRLHDILGLEEISVNSGHHQAVKTLPSGFKVSARAADGVIEALELDGERFVVGVQWHPEGTADWDAPSQDLFQAFVRACR